MFKLLPTHSKLFLLKDRVQNNMSQLHYQHHRQKVLLNQAAYIGKDGNGRALTKKGTLPQIHKYFRVERPPAIPKIIKPNRPCPIQLMLSDTDSLAARSRNETYGVSDED